MRRRLSPASGGGVVRRAPAEPTGAAGAGKRGGVLGLQQAVGNQATGALLSGGPQSLGAAREAPSLLGGLIPPPQVVRHGTAVALSVYFGQDLFLLDARNLAAVEALAEELTFMLEPAITVEGHASSEGDAAYNVKLSERRRDLVLALLAKDLDPRPNFGGTAHGEDAPAEAESGGGEARETQRAKNRRVEIVVVPKPGPLPEPPKPPRLRLEPEDTPPETPEERLERRLLEPPLEPPVRKKRSLSDLADEKLDEVLDDLLKGVGVENKEVRDAITPRLRDAIKGGVSRGVEEAVDSTNLDPAAKEALKRALEAGGKQEL